MRKLIFAFLLSLLFLLPGVARPLAAAAAPDWHTMADGKQYYGELVDIGGTKVLIEYDPATGQKTGYALINTGHWEEVPVQVWDHDEWVPNGKHTLYAVEDWHGPYWQGEAHLSVIWNLFGSPPAPLKVPCPYSTLPDYWRWLVFNVYNPNSWIVKCRVRVPGHYEGEQVFQPGETKQLRVVIPETGSGDFYLWANVHENYDPVAPDRYKVDPPADDGTGVCWTARRYQGVLIYRDLPNEPYYTSFALWGLRHGFKEIPVWTPDSPDGAWGKLSKKTVPAYVWTQVGSFSAWLERGYTQTNMNHPKLPYIVPGSLVGPVGSVPPGTPYQTRTFYSIEGKEYVRSWSQVLTFKSVMMNGIVVSPADEELKKYLDSMWPNRVYISYWFPNGGVYWTDPQRTGAFYFWCSYNNWEITCFLTYLSPVDLRVSAYDSDPYPDLPVGVNQIKFDSFGTGIRAIYSYTKTVSQKLFSITGSYIECVPIRNGREVVGSTVGYHVVVFNPSDYPVAFTLKRGWAQAKYWSWADITGAGVQVIPPHGYGVFVTSGIMFPQKNYLWGSYAPPPPVPIEFLHSSPTWFYGYELDADVASGSVVYRPMGHNQVWAYTIDGWKSDVMGYDYGWFKGAYSTLGWVDGTSGGPYDWYWYWWADMPSYKYGVPGLYGNFLWYEKAMTLEELAKFTSLHPTSARKMRELVTTGTATWRVNSVPCLNTDGRWYSVVNLDKDSS